ncbi:MAG: aldolase/citrate lyase family protein [Chloroflexi bacterium]|nr:aldolase/citrate lyase family protein [Chloroflexota bacterium]
MPGARTRVPRRGTFPGRRDARPGGRDGRPAVTYVNPLLERWSSGGAVLATWLTVPDALVAELLASCGWDAIIIDQQHGTVGPSEVATLAMGIQAGGAWPLTRVPPRDPAAIGRSLDAGVLGIVVPMIDTPDDAADAAAAYRYGTRGRRSYGPIRGAIQAHSTDPLDLESAALIPQIETAAGLAVVGEIASVPGVDALLVGPADLALALDVPVTAALRTPEQAERHALAVTRVRAACERAGIVAGIHTLGGDAAHARLAEGFRFVSVATDAAFLRVEATRALRLARGDE